MRLTIVIALGLTACASTGGFTKPPAGTDETLTGVIRRPIARTPQSVQLVVRETYGNARYEPATQKVTAENPLGRIEVTLRRSPGQSAADSAVTWFFIKGQRPVVGRVNAVDERGYVDLTKVRTVSTWVPIAKSDPMAAFAWERLQKVRTALEKLGPL